MTNKNNLQYIKLYRVWKFCNMQNCLISYPWPCPGVSLHQVGLELIHFVLSGGSHGGGVDLVHGVATQVGGQLNDDGGPPRAPLSHQYGVRGLVGWGNGPCQSTHLLYHSLQTTIMIQCKSHWYMSISRFLFVLCFMFHLINNWSLKFLLFYLFWSEGCISAFLFFVLVWLDFCFLNAKKWTFVDTKKKRMLNRKH